MKTQILATHDVPRKSLLASMLLAVALALAAMPTHAGPGIAWQDLSKEEQSVLKKHRADWSSLSPAQQEKLRKGARSYLQLPPEKRKAVERKHSQYEKMSPREREELREKYSRQKKHD